MKKIIIYPIDQLSIELLTEICDELAISEPIYWASSMLDEIIRDLIRRPVSAEIPASMPLEKNRLDAGLNHSVILFLGHKTPVVTSVIRHFKSRRQWPIFAVIVKPVLEMTLSCLIGHLKDDRHKEIDIKRRLSRGPAAGGR